MCGVCVFIHTRPATCGKFSKVHVQLKKMSERKVLIQCLKVTYVAMVKTHGAHFLGMFFQQWYLALLGGMFKFSAPNNVDEVLNCVKNQSAAVRQIWYISTFSLIVEL